VKEWILYCVLCSLIYAMSVQAAAPQPSYSYPQAMTAEVVFWNKAKLSVLDCAIFIPNLDEALGTGATEKIFYALKTKGYSPNLSPSLNLIELAQADSAGHKANEYYTDRDLKNLNRNGNGTLYLTLSGLRSTILKKHLFIVRLYTVGKAHEIAQTIRKGTLGQSDINLKDLPNCQPKSLSALFNGQLYTRSSLGNPSSSDEVASTL
jgi:hypothetical protein